MRKEKMTTSDANSLTEAKANLALNDLNRRERLLKIVRGEPTWKTYAWSGAMWLIFFVYIYNTGPINPVILLSALAVILSFYVGLSHRRMDALVELIGEDHLRKNKTDGDDADHCG